MKQARLFPRQVYCIDTDALINLKHYPSFHISSTYNLFPAIWEKLEDMIRNGTLISHIEVYNELERGKDDIYQWCKTHKNMFKDIDKCQLNVINRVKKKYDKGYWEHNTNKTGPWADPWLIALAICEDALIVTDESNKPNRIPVIAIHFGIKCLNLFDFFNSIGIKYEEIKEKG